MNDEPKAESCTVDSLVGSFGRCITIAEAMSYPNWDGLPDDPVAALEYWNLGYNVLQGNVCSGLCRHVLSCDDAHHAFEAAQRLNKIRTAHSSNEAERRSREVR